MFFVLSKTVSILLQPSALILLIGVAGLVLLMTRWRRAGQRLTIASVVLLLIAGVLPLGGVLSHALESRFPAWEQGLGRGVPDGIVILGGGISSNLSGAHGSAIVNADAGRVIAMAHLARLYPDARIIYSGGDASLLGNRRPEAEYADGLLDGLGIARSRLTLEANSRNTAENAAFSKALAQPKAGERWLLVTSAQHMPRAIGSFRRAGFPVEAHPVAWRTEKTYRVWPSLSVGENLARLDSAAKEWVGLIAYSITDRTSALFPAP